MANRLKKKKKEKKDKERNKKKKPKPITPLDFFFIAQPCEQVDIKEVIVHKPAGIFFSRKETLKTKISNKTPNPLCSD